MNIRENWLEDRFGFMKSVFFPAVSLCLWPNLSHSWQRSFPPGDLLIPSVDNLLQTLPSVFQMCLDIPRVTAVGLCQGLEAGHKFPGLPLRWLLAFPVLRPLLLLLNCQAVGLATDARCMVIVGSCVHSATGRSCLGRLNTYLRLLLGRCCCGGRGQKHCLRCRTELLSELAQGFPGL